MMLDSTARGGDMRTVQQFGKATMIAAGLGGALVVAVSAAGVLIVGVAEAANPSNPCRPRSSSPT